MLDEANNGLDARFQQKPHHDHHNPVHEQKDKEVQNDVETVLLHIYGPPVYSYEICFVFLKYYVVGRRFHF